VDALQRELDRTKYANAELECQMHELRLEQEKHTKLISSSIHTLGLAQLKKNVNEQG
jgi:hypothetical protein